MAFWDTLKIWSTLLSLLFATGTIYSVIRLWQIKAEEDALFTTLAPEPEPAADSRWMHVIQLAHSENPNEWRQAIIEADILLDLALAEHGYPGNTIGERLKSAQNLRTINAAWSAHKVRNNIAHAGSDFILTERDTKQAIENYAATLNELHEL